MYKKYYGVLIRKVGSWRVFTAGRGGVYVTILVERGRVGGRVGWWKQIVTMLLDINLYNSGPP